MANVGSRTGLDEALRLDAIYYSAPIPQNLAVLTVMGAVFDKVYFPGVCMPLKGFDQAELDKEIVRIEKLTGNKRPDDILLPMLKFVRHAKTLEGFCEFSGDYEHPFDNPPPQDMVRQIFDAIYKPLPEGWEPMFSTNHHKGIPGSDEHITYPGQFHYLASAIRASGQTGPADPSACASDPCRSSTSRRCRGAPTGCRPRPRRRGTPRL